MNLDLIEKYFKDQCSEEEIEDVLNWFRTKEGQAFLQRQMHEQFEQPIKTDELPFVPGIDSQKVFARIQRHKQPRQREGRWVMARVASIVLLVALLSSLLYWSGVTLSGKQPPSFTTYITQAGQQSIFTLSDGTVIRLNEESKLLVPAKLQDGYRRVTLEGEAYFEVARDPEHPFVVYAGGAAIEVLGTKFNVKIDGAADNVQVAVIEGKVSLKKKGPKDSASALLTRNKFGLLDLADGSIMIEPVQAGNYISWATHRLVYNGQTLAQVSRDLERLYDVQIYFADPQLKRLTLSADIERGKIDVVAATIANTFDIQHTIHNQKLIWKAQKHSADTMNNDKQPNSI